MAIRFEFAARTFDNLENFPKNEYSKLKFGNDSSAKKLGQELAAKLVNMHIDFLLPRDIIVIASPYNYIHNAATIMTKHFINELNDRLVQLNGNHVEYSVIHRKMSYTRDYGFLNKDQRKGLIDNDAFYINKDFVGNKLIIFIDDVKITGTHEEKLKEILQREQLDNDCIFAYYGKYTGNNAEIEGQLNFSAITHIQDYIVLANTPDHEPIIRPIKYILSRTPEEVKTIIHSINFKILEKIYHGCLAEGYYKIPEYQHNFGIIRDYMGGIE